MSGLENLSIRYLCELCRLLKITAPQDYIAKHNLTADSLSFGRALRWKGLIAKHIRRSGVPLERLHRMHQQVVCALETRSYLGDLSWRDVPNWRGTTDLILEEETSRTALCPCTAL